MQQNAVLENLAQLVKGIVTAIEVRESPLRFILQVERPDNEQPYQVVVMPTLNVNVDQTKTESQPGKVSVMFGPVVASLGMQVQCNPVTGEVQP